MDIIEAIKTVYACTQTRAAVYDTTFRELWRNSPGVPELCFPEGLTASGGVPPGLPVSEEIICSYSNGDAVKITPLIQDGRLCGYLTEWYGMEDIHKLDSCSDRGFESEVVLGLVRKNMNKVLLTAEELGSPVDELDTDAVLSDLRTGLRSTLASLVNHGEMSYAYSSRPGKELVDLSEKLAEPLSQAKEILRHSGCVLNCDLGFRCYARTDLRLVISSVMNLIINAYMYSSAEEKRIDVLLKCEDFITSLTVSDNGTSADIEQIRRLSFYDNRRISITGGESVGLALVRRTAEMFGGRLELSLSPTGGLTASIVFDSLSDGDLSCFRASAEFIQTAGPYDLVHCILAKGIPDLGGTDSQLERIKAVRSKQQLRR
ncbi:MAG: sensor histidine kinase [Ruminococcus sp.]|nr:sensor histidine kinase [Ruminococcus sp.]